MFLRYDKDKPKSPLFSTKYHIYPQKSSFLHHIFPPIIFENFQTKNKTNNFIILHDSKTGYNRLDRNRFNINNIQLQQLIHLGFFSDYHCYRPYNKYKDVNEKIYELL